MNINLYQTHIEICPYELGSVPRLEKMLSKYDTVTHKYIPIGYYYDGYTLYIPRGVSLVLLKQLFGCQITVTNRCDEYDRIPKYQMLFDARDKIQEESIDFLTTSSERFMKGNLYSQFGLNLDTGDGKTFCMISAIVSLKIKSIIITHKKSIKEQWISSILNMSNVPQDKLCDISGSSIINQIMNDKIDADIYVVNHQTLTSYARTNGWDTIRELFRKMRVGIKVVDESHKFFENSLMIDFFSNVYRSYYLTATFNRSDPKEIKIYKLAYSSLYRFGEETFNYEEIYFICPSTFSSFYGLRRL
jgi:hypothetical protein